MVRTIENIQVEFRRGAKEISPELIKYIKEWVGRHIRNADNHFEKFISQCQKNTSTEKKKPVANIAPLNSNQSNILEHYKHGVDHDEPNY